MLQTQSYSQLIFGSHLNIAVSIIATIIGIALLYRFIFPLIKNLIINQKKLQESEEKFKASFENAGIGMALVDLNGRWLQVNQALCNIVGYSEQELLTMDFQTITHPDDLKTDLEYVQDLLAGKIHSYQMEKRYIHKNGHTMWILLNGSIVRDKANQPLYFIAQVQDITARKAAEQSLQQAHATLENHYQKNAILSALLTKLQSCIELNNAYPPIIQCCSQLFPSSSGGLYLFNPELDHFSIAASWGNLSEHHPDFMSKDCYAIRCNQCKKFNRTDKKSSCIHAIQHKSHLCIPLTSQQEIVGLLYIEFEANSEVDPASETLANYFAEQISLALSNVKLRETLQYQSFHDPLTELYNRRYLDQFFSKEISRAKRNNTSIAVMMLDLDYFKIINDKFGHEAGDNALKQIGQLLTDNMRETDLVCRFGGEEFTLILPELTREKAIQKAEQLRNLIAQLPLHITADHTHNITCSIGIAFYPEHGTSAESLLTAADHALYQAKNNGRNQVVVAEVRD